MSHSSHPSQFALLSQRRFGPFFWTQFLGAFNDNLFKTALMVALKLGANAAIPLLLRHGAKSDLVVGSHSVLTQAVADNNLKFLRLLLKDGMGYTRAGLAETIRPDAARFFRSRPGAGRWQNPLAEKDGQPGVVFRWMEVEGPILDEWPTAGHRRLFGSLPMRRATGATAGVEVETGADFIRARGKPTRPVEIVTEPYPGFPTDLQAQFMALQLMVDGRSTVTERIYPARFMHAAELQRMGAEIAMDGATAAVYGGRPLSGAPVMASDLRASAALILAAGAALLLGGLGAATWWIKIGRAHV